MSSGPESSHSSSSSSGSRDSSGNPSDRRATPGYESVSSLGPGGLRNLDLAESQVEEFIEEQSKFYGEEYMGGVPRRSIGHAYTIGSWISNQTGTMGCRLVCLKVYWGEGEQGGVPRSSQRVSLSRKPKQVAALSTPLAMLTSMVKPNHNH